MMEADQNIFMIGIGGMGMCPLALYLVQSGMNISGVDDSMRPEVASILQDNNIVIGLKEIPQDCDCVIYSSAIREDNIFILEARRRGLCIMRRGEYLAAVAKKKKLIAIVGSHGKSTTTAMLIHALNCMRFDFSYFLGALFYDNNVLPARFSQNEWLVAEIDESDGTIDAFEPEVTLVVNFDWDHPSQYATVEDLKMTFSNLFKKTKRAIMIPWGCSILNSLCKEGIGCEIYTYGDDGGDYQGICTVTQLGETKLITQGYLPRMECSIPNGGRFNAHNGLAALSVVHFLMDQLTMEPFSGFLGVKRRQELLYGNDQFKVIMDYAHHPAEIEAFLEYTKSYSNIEGSASVVVFQPHRYTRTQIYYKEFARVLQKADRVLLLPVYAASESYLEEGASERIIESFDNKDQKLKFVDYSKEMLFRELPGNSLEKSTNVFFIGAGDIELLALEYKRLLEWNDWWDVLLGKKHPETKMARNEPLASKTTLRLGGSALFYIEPASLDDLLFAIKGAYNRQCPIFMLGRGSNLLVADEGFHGLVIRLNHPDWREIRDLGGGKIWAGAGARLKEICGYACKFGLAGFEFFEGIPGSLGGSLRMNAGAMGAWLFDVIESIKCISLDGSIKEYSKDVLTLGYRFCKDLENSFAIGAILKSSELRPQEFIRNQMDTFANKRKITQPREPSAGCIFKNPEGNYAGKLIEESGLKGYRIGAAEVSSIHCNFIVNKGGATSGDVVQLVRTIRSKVYQTSGIYLEPEVLFLGKSWDEELRY